MALRILLSVIQLVSINLFAQQNQDFITSLSTTQIGEIVRIDFTVEAGTSYCTGIILERSTNGIIFEAIAQIAGVCGGSEFEEAYTLNDPNPIAGAWSSYRLDLGNIGKSQISGIRFVPLTDGITIFPNPVSDVANIFFNNKERSDVYLKLYDSSGHTIKSMKYYGVSSLSIDLSDLLNGSYRIELIVGDKVLSRLIVLL